MTWIIKMILRWTPRAIASIVIVFGIGVMVAQNFGTFESSIWSFIEDNAITAFAITVSAAYFAFDYLHRRGEEADTSLKETQAEIKKVAERTEREIDTSMDTIKKIVAGDAFDHVAQAVDDLDDFAKSIVGPELDELKSNLFEVRSSDKYTVIGRERFRVFWSRNVHRAKGGVIRATAHPDPDYFFDPRHTDVTSAIMAHKRAGGDMIRTFFMSDEDFEKEQCLEILRQQHEVGVEVWTARKSMISDRLVQYILVHDANLFGWKLRLEGSHHITHCEAELTEDGIKKLADTLNEIQAQPGVERFIP